MQVKCNLCGGDNTVHPGQKMLFCAYCGSALTVDERDGPEHLILPHKRNDKRAKEVLCSFLLSKQMPRPKNVKIEFRYIPFTLKESGNSTMKIDPAPGAPAITGTLPHPPAGNYRFFDPSHADGETVVPVEKIETDTVKILHLPVYRLTFTAGGEWNATAIGESWQVIAGELPAERPAVLNLPGILAAAGLFMVYLVLGNLVSRWPGRLALIMGAAAAGLALFIIREKVVKRA